MFDRRRMCETGVDMAQGEAVRMRLSSTDSREPAMDAVDAIYTRRAIRDFTDQVPPREEVEALIEAAIQAPNGLNRQPWAFVVAEGRPLLAEWSTKAKAYFAATTDSALQGFREHLALADFNIFYNAPVLVVICATNPDPMSMKDCCLAAQNLMLAAHDRGLGSCWIGFAEPWLGSAEGRDAAGIPDDHTPVAPIIVGRPKTTPPRPHRNPPLVRWLTPAPASAQLTGGT
jgi:nitroreductase